MNDEELERKINEQAQSEYAKMKAKAEAEARELSLIAQDPNKALQTKLNMKVAEHIDKSQDVAEKINQTADKLVEKGLKTQEHKVNKELKESERDENKAEFELDEDNYRAFGQETAPRKGWKKKMIEIGNDFWFCCIFVICFFTLAPFYNFTKVIKTQNGILKFVAISTGVLMLLACLGGFTYWILNLTGVVR
jgi:hypothetical protein